MSYFGEYFWVSKIHSYFGGVSWKGLWGLLGRWRNLVACGQSPGQMEGLQGVEVNVGGVRLGLNL